MKVNACKLVFGKQTEWQGRRLSQDLQLNTGHTVCKVRTLHLGEFTACQTLRLCDFTACHTLRLCPSVNPGIFQIVQKQKASCQLAVSLNPPRLRSDRSCPITRRFLASAS